MFKKSKILKGLPGNNPLGFIAALGLQTLFSNSESAELKLCWSETPIPYAAIDYNFPYDKIASQSEKVIENWISSVAISPPVKQFGKAAANAKFSASDIRKYLLMSSESDASSFSQSIVAEGCLAKTDKDKAKPTELCFASGNQRFLSAAREILKNVSGDDIAYSIDNLWEYKDDAKGQSLMWDVRDDRQYALSPKNPSPQPKTTNIAIEALAVIGLSRFPVFPDKNWIKTTSVIGKWSGASFLWPLWRYPVGYHTAGYLVSHISSYNEHKYPCWGVFNIMQSDITRNDQGGYGTFRPAKTIWSSK